VLNVQAVWKALVFGCPCVNYRLMDHSFFFGQDRQGPFGLLIVGG
jgi:2-hydroxychromene-2-carboxylate isomerase